MIVSKGFGDLADERASDPVTLIEAARRKQKASSVVDPDGSLIKKVHGNHGKRLDENYFGKQFSHTPQNMANNHPTVIIEEVES